QIVGDSLITKRALLQLAHTYDADSDYDNALNYYRQVANLEAKGGAEEKKSVSELKVLGKFGEASCLEELARYEEALDAFNAVLETYPSRKVVEIRIDRLTQRMREAHK